jgi:hypothetical protein
VSHTNRFRQRMVGAVALSALLTVPARANDIQGPSSSESPYVVRAVPGVVTKSILTVGDSVNEKPDGAPYRLVGIPDGLGAFDNGDGTFTVLINHEIPSGLGIVRAHGANGAFVSRWVIDKSTLEVLHGEDLIQNVSTWNSAASAYNPPAQGVAIARLCSANLAAQSAFYDAATGLGYDGRLFMDGEEVGAEGRAFAHALNGTSWELPRLGKFSWENSVANPGTGTRTVTIGLDDTNPEGQLYVYVGEKTGAGSPVDQAGLTNGVLYGVKVEGVFVEDAAAGIPSGTPFSLYDFGNVENLTGAQLDSLSLANDVTRFLRPEDGAWDPENPNDFYFVTTATFTTSSRLWRLRFVDASDPALGGHVDMLLDGSEGQHMMDNLTMTGRGQVVIQEDPGNQPHRARIWRYSIAHDELSLVAEHDPRRFAPGGDLFLTQDEESSGIIDVSDILGEGWFLLDVQAHYAIPGELVEGGQLLALHYPPGKK